MGDSIPQWTEADAIWYACRELRYIPESAPDPLALHRQEALDALSMTLTLIEQGSPPHEIADAKRRAAIGLAGMRLAAYSQEAHDVLDDVLAAMIEAGTPVTGW